MSDRQADIERISENLASIYEARDRYRQEMRTLTRDLVSTAAAVGIDLLNDFLSTRRDRTAQPQRSPSVSVTPTMMLEGPSGSVATGAFVVENVLSQTIAVKLQWTEFRAEDGTTLSPDLKFTPSELGLAPSEHAVVEVAVSLDEPLQVDLVYRGEIFVAELPGTRLRVDLRRRSASDSSDAPVDAGGPSSGELEPPGQ